MQKLKAALLMHSVSSTILSTRPSTIFTNSSNSLMPTLCLRYYFKTTSIAMYAFRGLAVSIEPMMQAMGISPRQAMTVRSGQVLMKQQQVKIEQGYESSALRMWVIHCSSDYLEKVCKVICSERLPYIFKIIKLKDYQSNKAHSPLKQSQYYEKMAYRCLAVAPLIINFIMKIQNIEEVRQELFNGEVKLTPKQKIKKQHFLLKIPLFDLIYQKKGDLNFQIILANIKLIKVDFGEIIFQNEDQRTFNYIIKGAVLLFTRTKNEERREQAKFYKRLEVGEHFGEKMQYGKQQLQSARSATSGYLLQLPMNVFYNTFSGHFKYDELRDRINFLKSIWVFSQVKRTLLEKILLSSQCKKYTRKTVLAPEDSIPNEIMVIMEGELALNISKEGKSKAFCVLGKGEVCGVEEIIEDKAYEYTASVTSDYAEILKVDRQIMVDIVDRDIKPELIKKRRQLVIDLKLKNLDTKKLMMYSQKQLDTAVKETKPKFLSHRKRYKSEGGQKEPANPINRLKVLNELFNREVQLKESELRRYKLQHIEENHKHIYNSTRISTYTNHSCTYDKEIIVKYLGRKQRKYQDILRRQRQFIERRIVVIPELRVERSSAVKNQKRKLKHSRKQFYSTLQIYD